MTVEMVTRNIFHCRCLICKHEWDAFQKPARCASCKNRTWNGEDYRNKLDPFKNVPVGSLINIKAPPAPRNKDLLEAFTQTKDILEELIADFTGVQSVVREQAVLDKVNRQIKVIKRAMGDGKPA